MAYNLSRKVCDRNRLILKRMAEERGTFTIPSRAPKFHAVKIREALEAVQHHEDYKKAFGHLKTSYRVLTGPRSITLEWYGGNLAMDSPIVTADQLSPEDIAEAVEQLDKSIKDDPEPNVLTFPVLERPRVVVDGVTDLLQVLSAAIRLNEEEEILFSDANLPDPDKKRLFDWCQTKNWKYIDHYGAGLTLTRKNVDEFLLWEEEA